MNITIDTINKTATVHSGSLNELTEVIKAIDPEGYMRWLITATNLQTVVDTRCKDPYAPPYIVSCGGTGTTVLATKMISAQ